MRCDDMDHRGLLELDPEAGAIRFAGERAILLDAVAMGLMRKSLVESLGLAGARTLLAQFGFAQGWRMAGAIRARSMSERDAEWLPSDARVPSLEGLFRFASASGPLSKEGARLVASYEAEQHLLHFGRSERPVCFMIGGIMSGYLSRTSGKEIYALEDRCAGRGDAACRFFARSREEWGCERADEVCRLHPSRLKECLDILYLPVIESLRADDEKLRAQCRQPLRVTGEVEVPSHLVANSHEMRQLVDLTRRVAKVDSSVLVTGESGTGKERIARLIHDESMRAAGPFVAVNCAAIPETLLESELFGHARGAFTGATHERSGLFEASAGGTLLLDEISEISPGMQVKLLRALQEREVRRVGENRSRPVDVRVVATTNRDLAKEIERGAFRQDLFYRLKVVELHVPPLRMRRDDVLSLARVLLEDAARRMKRSISGIAPDAADHLLRYEWPGNVRELENAMERAVALARGGRVELADLPDEVRLGATRLAAISGPVRRLDEVEKDYILAALALNQGNQSRTAEQLSIGSATLYRKLKAYGSIGGGCGADCPSKESLS